MGFFFGAVNSAVQFEPPDSGNILSWLRSTSVTVGNGNPVPTWPALIGASASQPNATYQPTYISSVLNGFPAIRGNGTNSCMDAVISGTGPYTVVMVGKQLSDAVQFSRYFNIDQVQNGCLFRDSAFGLDGIYFNPTFGPRDVAVSTSDFHILICTFSGTVGALEVDGVETLGNTGNGVSTLFSLFAMNPTSFPLNCDIMEICLYNSALSSGDKTIWRDYLTDRYAL